MQDNSLQLSDEMFEIYGFPQKKNPTVEEFLKFIHPEDITAVRDKMQNVKKNTDSYELIYRIIRVDGMTRWVRVHAKTTLDPQSTPLKIVGTLQDVTKEKEVDQAKSEFVSLASHQLRTPLSAINWYTEMLIAGDAGNLSEEQKKYLQEVYAANHRMVDLVNSLLNVSRLELGTFTVEPQAISIKEISQSVLGELKPQIVQKNLHLKEDYDESIGLYMADPKLMRIIIQNFLTNAVKYTPENGSISISLMKDIENILIKVSDSGYGIPKDQQSKIFSKLFRADNVKEKDTEGTGLGLYIIKSIVSESKGKVWFESEENKGTTFFVTLPLSGMQKKDGAKQLS